MVKRKVLKFDAGYHPDLDRIYEAMAEFVGSKPFKVTIEEDTKPRGNPNQKATLEDLRRLGFKAKVKRNQICIEGMEPMTVVEAREMIAELFQEGLKLYFALHPEQVAKG